MTVLYLVPGLVVGALIAGESAAWRRPGLFLAAVLLFLIGLTPYLYLPLRSLADPLLDWGDPSNVQRLLRHVAGSQYRVWLFASKEGFSLNLVAFLRELVTLPGLPLIVAALAGMFAMWRRDRPGLARLGLGFVIGSLWASGYEIHDLTPYFLIPRLCLAGLGIAGLAFVFPLGHRRTGRVLLVVIPLAAALILGVQRWPGQTRRGDTFVRFYATSLLTTLPPNTILLTRYWDLVVSPILYLQQVEGLRRDVTVVDTELLRRSWYFPQLRRTDPALLEPIEGKVSAFLEQLRLFEARSDYDPREIEERYRAVISGIFEAHRESRPIFHTPDVEQTFYGDWSGIPEALAVRMVRDPITSPAAEPCDLDRWAQVARFANEDVRRIAWLLPIDLARSRIRFLHQFEREEEAERWQTALTGLQAIEIGER
jgi:hypothetical protein